MSVCTDSQNALLGAPLLTTRPERVYWYLFHISFFFKGPRDLKHWKPLTLGNSDTAFASKCNHRHGDSGRTYATL